MNGRINTLGIAALCATLAANEAGAALSLTYVGKVTRSTAAANLESSGITWTGGDSYYMVEDTATNLWRMTVPINRSTGAITGTVSCVSSTKIKGASGAVAYDMEGCAFDPCSGKVWISQEQSALIREFLPGGDGTVSRSAPVPTIQKQYYGNLSLESLTISGDGKTMWTVNEEALKVDGSYALLKTGTVVRLTRFIRSSVWDNWTASGQWAYLVEPVGSTDTTTERTTSDHSRSGIADLCVLPDGTLLTMERRCYNETGWYPDFQIRIYQVDFSGADDISTLPSLNNATYKKVSKRLLWASSTSDIYYTQGLPNFEGMCLGPRLDDGSCALVLIADGGSYGARDMMTFKLSGLNVRTMAFDGPSGCEPYGGPYRYVHGTTITNTLPGAGKLHYETNLVSHAIWSAPANGASGEGSTAVFAVTADDTLTWSTTTNTSLPMVAVDSFERIPVATEADGLDGWNGEGWVVATNYTPALPPGYPLTNEVHTQVLMVDGDVTRDYNTSGASGVVLDTMVRATIPTADTPVEDADDTDILAFHFNANGCPVLQHRTADGTGRVSTVLSTNKYANSDWLRVTIAIKKVDAKTWCQVRINGETCVSTNGYRLPTDTGKVGTWGSWHRAISDKATVSTLALKGTGAVDDVALYTASGIPEFDVTDEHGERLPDADFYEWMWLRGLPFDPNFDADGDGASSKEEWRNGNHSTNPWDKSDNPKSRTITVFSLQ